MKIRFCAALLLAALSILIFAGCGAAAIGRLDAIEDAVEYRLDTAEDAIESQVEAIITDDPTPAASAPAKAAVLLTKEDAEKIALEHAGFTAEQVQRLRTELDYDRGRPEYEVDFHVDRWEYDYEIDAEIGTIITWDKDWDD